MTCRCRSGECEPECDNEILSATRQMNIELRAENDRLRTEVRLLTQILQLEFARRLPKVERMRKVHEIISSLRFGFHKR
jgi:hypothetical protein